MKKFNLHNIMTKAWELVKKFHYTMSMALKTAWANAKRIAKAVADNLITEVVHTWYAWKELGMEVIHESKALFQVEVIDPKTKKGTRILSYFGESQVAPIAE